MNRKKTKAGSACRRRQSKKLLNLNGVTLMQALLIMMMFPTLVPHTIIRDRLVVEAFTPTYSFQKNLKPVAKISRLSSSSDDQEYDDNNHNDNMESLVDQNKPLLSQRLTSLRAQILNEEMTQRPPNPNLEPVEFVKALLSSLMHTDHPLPDSGYRVLIRCSAPRWKEALRKSIGAPVGANEEDMVSALSGSMPRPNNQFGILVDSGDDWKEDHNDDDDEEDQCDNGDYNGSVVYGNYRLTFPRDVLDWEDGTCWLESQLRDPTSGELFAILGWNLIKREEDGAWIVEWLDWQDFRDAFRPGIGREEWSRICG